METTINEVTPVEYELEIRATADDLAPALDDALRAQRAQTDIKGFRKGKVPLSTIKKMYGKAIGYKVAEELVQDTFEDEMEATDLDVIGRPTLTQLDYELDDELHAVVHFGVRPEVELKDLSGEQVDALAYDVTDDEVEESIDDFRKQRADLIPLEEEPTDTEDYVSVDLQRIDPGSGTPIIGEKEEDMTFFLDDERLKDELREALVGKKAGDTFRLEMPHEHDDHDDEQQLIELPGEEPSGGDASSHVDVYEVTLKDAKRPELPELDDAFVQEATNGEVETEDELRAEIRRQIEQNWEQQAQEFLQNNIVERMMELHSVSVPDAVIEMNLDAFVEDVKERNDGELPEDFDETAFRQANRQQAEQQGRWMFIRDQVAEDEGVEATEDDLDEFFEQQGGGPISPEEMRRLYRSTPRVQAQIDQRILSEKVFDVLTDRFELVEKDAETIEREMQERREMAAQAQPGQPAPAPSPGQTA